MPDREWRKPEIRHALRERAAGTLLSLVQKHAVASQARLATATGIGQGRLNEIINGHRQVARLDVLERIAGGLAMPDDARVLFGLAPVHAETALARLAEFADHPFVRMRTALYGSLPTWRLLVFDGTLYLSACAPSSEGHRSGMYKLTAAGDGVLYAGSLRQFDNMWRQARREDAR